MESHQTLIPYQPNITPYWLIPRSLGPLSPAQLDDVHNWVSRAIGYLQQVPPSKALAREIVGLIENRIEDERHLYLRSLPYSDHVAVMEGIDVDASELEALRASRAKATRMILEACESNIFTLLHERSRLVLEVERVEKQEADEREVAGLAERVGKL